MYEVLIKNSSTIPNKIEFHHHSVILNHHTKPTIKIEIRKNVPYNSNRDDVAYEYDKDNASIEYTCSMVYTFRAEAYRRGPTKDSQFIYHHNLNQ